MSDNFLGKIKLLPYDWPTKSWLLCIEIIFPSRN